MSLLLALLLLFPAAAAAAVTEESAPVEGAELASPRAALILRVRDSLASDPARAEELAARILRSSIAGDLVGEDADPAAARQDLLAWIRDNPEDAAHLAVGFAGDAAAGTDAFERSLRVRYRRRHELNPNRYGGILGRLDRAARLSKTVGGETDLDEEEQRKLIKNLFEGETGGQGKIDGPKQGRAAAAAPPPAAYAGAGAYDRLQRANLTGYSPEVQALQSEMNRRRPPGAPRLIESGRLDFATLRYPYFGLEYDIGRLEESLKTQRAYALARILGEESRYSAASLADPEVRRALEASAGGRLKDPGFEARQEAIEEARRALREFDAEAGRTRSPAGITAARLRRLSELRRRAAVWITTASLDEALQRLAAVRGFLDRDLRAAVSKAPASGEERRGFLRAGERLDAAIGEALSRGRRARDMLTGYSGGPLDEADRLVSAVRTASKSLPARVSEYGTVAVTLAALGAPSTGWRARADELALRLLPRLSYCRELKKRRERRKALLESLRRIGKDLTR